MNQIKLDNISRSKHQLSITYFFNDYRFEVALWYDTVDFSVLESRYGRSYIDWLCFHIAAFEFNKLTSLRPDQVDFGDYRHYCTKAFFTLWLKIQQKVWAQWRYENNAPNYQGPALAHLFASLENIPQKVSNQLGTTEVLAFCGGGKDSLVSARLLENLNIPYASFVYSNSIYGTAQKQHQLIDQLLSGLKPSKVHRQFVYDSFVDCPILNIATDIPSSLLLAAETPSSIFASLPIVLTEGYHHIALGHERSANVGNLIWEKTGEDINHQWGKSYEAEQLLNSYIKQSLIDNFSYFSILQPIYDVVIFNLLKENTDLLPYAHSCNISKPWCKKCPKCAYVWLNYMAYLPVDLINQIFDGVNLLDIEENQLWFEQMLGLGAHTPFECIGQIEESRLALHLCKQKGVSGKAMRFYEAFKQENFEQIAEHFTTLNTTQIGYPEKYKQKILDKLTQTAEKSKYYIQSKSQEVVL